MHKTANQEGKYSWLIIFLLCLTLFIFGNNISQIKQVITLLRQEKDIDNQLGKARDKNNALKEEISYIQTEDFIKKEAREKLGLGDSNDVAYILPPIPTIVPSSQETPKTVPNWEQWLNRFIY